MKPWMKALVALRIAGYLAIGGYFGFKAYHSREPINNPQNPQISIIYPSLVFRNAPIKEISLRVATDNLERKLK